MRKSKNTTTTKGDRRVLVRADAITYLSADDHQVRATELGSDDITVLADEKDAGHNGPLLPEGFNLDLLFAISEARRRASEADDDPHGEDRVLVAQVDDGEWVWREFRPSAPEPKPVP
ncbi:MULTISPECIES: hypothetical protein [unclassified Streptomyces]|uniref:hypothetical protein n=1 Tax=unclassified Streptomyces TaxID=2593676 RepID=UPI003829DFE1